MNAFRRKNGFTWPFDYRQVISWLILIYFILMSYGTYCVAMVQPWSYIIAIVSFFSFLLKITKHRY